MRRRAEGRALGEGDALRGGDPGSVAADRDHRGAAQEVRGLIIPRRTLATLSSSGQRKPMMLDLLLNNLNVGFYPDAMQL
jgi:hypothetical protein